MAMKWIFVVCVLTLKFSLFQAKHRSNDGQGYRQFEDSWEPVERRRRDDRGWDRVPERIETTILQEADKKCGCLKELHKLELMITKSQEKIKQLEKEMEGRNKNHGARIERIEHCSERSLKYRYCKTPKVSPFG